jgi:delta 1-pyrroline-5-carboxylate dehydrogenase
MPPKKKAQRKSAQPRKKAAPKKAAPKKLTPRAEPEVHAPSPPAETATVASMIAPFRTKAIAEAVKIAPDNVSAWKVGRYLPSANKLHLLAAFCGFDIDEFVAVWMRERDQRLSKLRKPKAVPAAG